MDIRRLLNPSSSRGGPTSNTAPSPSLRDDSVGELRGPSRSCKSAKQLYQDEHSAPLLAEKYRNSRHPRGSSYNTSPITARSSISSLSSFQSSNSASSGATSASSLVSQPRTTCLSSPSVEKLRSGTRDNFKVSPRKYGGTFPTSQDPIYSFYSPCESSEHSPSTQEAQYIPAPTEYSQDQSSIKDIGESESLNTLAALAVRETLKAPTDDVVHAARTLTDSQNTPSYNFVMPKSYVSQLRQSQKTPRAALSISPIAMSDEDYQKSPVARQPPNPASSVTSSIPTDIQNSDLLSYSEEPILDDDYSAAPKCSYVQDCNTSSPLRKVVSHIFGRNKLSTRQIPRNIWVYYCRKHYQRSRYRDPKGFAKLQCDLVQRQVERLASWGGVEDWVIKVRRREEIRISRESRGVLSRSPEGSDEHDGWDTATVSTERDPYSVATNDAHWISSMAGSGKDVDDVRLLLSRIEREIINRGGIFPDVEILPNVKASALSITGSTGNSLKTEDVAVTSFTAPSVETSNPRKSKGFMENLMSQCRQLPSKASLEQAMVFSGNVASAHSKVTKARSSPNPDDVNGIVDEDRYNPSLSRPKRKASKPLPVTVLPDTVESFSAYTELGMQPLPELQGTSLAVENSVLLKYRSKRPRPGSLDPEVDLKDIYNVVRPISPVSSIPTRRGSYTGDMLPLPLLAQTIEHQLRSSVDPEDTLALAALPMVSEKATGESFCTFEGEEFKVVLVTPPPSACGDMGRSSSEPPVETKDNGVAELGVIEAQPLFAIDPESPDRCVLAVEVPQHVREFVMGSWSKKRAVRMQNLFGGNQIARPMEPRHLRYQPAPITRRKPNISIPKLPLQRKFIAQNAQEYVVLAKDRFARSAMRQMRTVSFALQSEPVDESSVAPPCTGQKRRSLSLLSSKVASNPTTPSRRKQRASSAGPTRRKADAAHPMKRTVTAPPKPALESSSRSWLRGPGKGRGI